MPTLRNILARLLPPKNFKYELVSTDSEQSRRRNQPYRSSRYPFRRIFTLRNFFILVSASVTLVVCAVLFNGGIPPLYSDIRSFERGLPQHNLTFSQHSGVKYISFPDHIWGHGWNNVLQEYLMLSYLAYITQRAFVFEDYTWSHLPLPYTIYDFALRPSRTPLNAYISGPTAGGFIDASPESPPRAVDFKFWEMVCPPQQRRVITSADSPNDLKGLALVEWWKDAIDRNADATCLEVNTKQRTIFDFEFFGTQQLLDIWPSLSQSAILTRFTWSPLVLSAIERNFVILPTLHDPGVGVLRRRSYNPRINRSPVPSPSSTLSSPPTGSTYPALLAVHIRRGDYKRHCSRLAEWGGKFHGFNSFEGLPDRFSYNGSSTNDRSEYYRKRCLPTQDEIVDRLHVARAEHDTFISSQHTQKNNSTQSSITPMHKLRHVFVLTNAWSIWLDGLKQQLMADGWEDVTFGGELMLDKEQRGVDVAVDMSIAEKAEVFVGNGFSSLSGNIVMLRTANGLPVQTNRFL